MQRDSCTCTPGNSFLKPRCPSCAAWEAGYVLAQGQRLMDRASWIRLHMHPVHADEAVPDYTAYHADDTRACATYR